MSEGYGWWERALARPAPVAPGVRAKALLASAYFQYNVGDADAHFEESLALFQELGDKHGVARALHALGHLEESLALFRELGDRHGIAGSLQALGQTHESEDLLAQSLALYRELGDTGETALEHFGALLRDKGDYARANLLFDEGLELAERLGHKDGMAWLLRGRPPIFGYGARTRSKSSATWPARVRCWTMRRGRRRGRTARR